VHDFAFHWNDLLLMLVAEDSSRDVVLSINSELAPCQAAPNFIIRGGEPA